MTVAYELVNPSNAETKKWLENNCDPRPVHQSDGYSRYGNWLRKFQGRKRIQTCQIENMEEWPGGRYNHYIFDLNRDWAWQTQAESQQRFV
jgi:hypothetical protein